MLLSLLRFVIRTRFSGPFLILIAVILVYSVGISMVIPSQVGDVMLSYYGTGIIAFFLAMALATGGVMVLKSDRDYLFTLPLSPRDLSVSIFFSQFLAFGISVFFIFTYLGRSFSSPLLIVDLFALALTFTSLGVIAPSLATGVRLALALAMAFWTLLSFAGFPFTPASAFNGNVIGGTATLIALAGVTTTAAFRSLSRIELDMMRNLVRSTSAEIKSQQTYAGKTPTGAIYSMNLSMMSLAGRMNMAGTSRYVSRRVSTSRVLAASSIAAFAYLLYVIYQGPPVPLVAGTNTLPAAILTSVLLSLLTFFFSQSAIANERVWLSLTSIPPAKYFRHLISSKVLSIMLILVPFAVADGALVALGYGEALGALAVVVFIIPPSFVLEVLWAAYVAPIQIRGDDQSMPAQFSIRQLATALPLIPVFILSSVATLFPLVSVGAGVFLILVSAALTLSERFWNRVVVKLTENGFV